MATAQLHRCPDARVVAKTVHARTIHQACVKLGGIHELAVHLGVTDAQIDLWLEGKDTPPSDVFFLAVDVILGRR